MVARQVPLAATLLIAALGCERSEPPEHLSRLRDMRRAAPPTWDVTKLGLCPQSPDAEAIAAAPPGSGAAVGIVCSLSLHNYKDTPAIKLRQSDERADMDVRARLGTETGPYFFYASGPEDQNDMSMVFPVTGLQKSDRLVIQVLERNFSGTDYIDGLKATLDGPPPFSLVGQLGIAALKCRELDEATRDKFVASREEDARRLFAELARARPDPRKQGFAWPSEHEDKAEAGLHAIVALLGWDHPRAKGWVDELADARALGAAAYAKLFAAERAASREAALPNGLVVRGRRNERGFELEVQNRSREAVDLKPFESVSVLDADATSDEYSTEIDQKSPLAPGAAATLPYHYWTHNRHGKQGGTAGRPPFLVRGKLYKISAPLGAPLRAAGRFTLTASAACDGEKLAAACGAAQSPTGRGDREPSRCRCVVVELRNTTAAPINIEDERRTFELSFRVRATSRALASRLQTQAAPASPVLPPGGAVEDVYALIEADLAPDQIMLDFSERAFDNLLPWSLAVD